MIIYEVCYVRFHLSKIFQLLDIQIFSNFQNRCIKKLPQIHLPDYLIYLPQAYGQWDMSSPAYAMVAAVAENNSISQTLALRISGEGQQNWLWTAQWNLII